MERKEIVFLVKSQNLFISDSHRQFLHRYTIRIKPRDGIFD